MLTIITRNVRLHVVTLRTDLYVDGLILLLMGDVIRLLSFTLSILGADNGANSVVFRILGFREGLAARLAILISTQRNCLGLMGDLRLLFGYRVYEVFLYRGFFVLSLGLVFCLWVSSKVNISLQSTTFNV